MISAPEPKPPAFATFRLRLLVAMMLVVSVVAALGLWFAQNRATANAQRELERQFQDALASLHAVQDIRNAALAERCRALALRPRIHAALEDNALDLLYPSAREELADVRESEEIPSSEAAGYTLHARFYRFLGGRGKVIPPPEIRDAGALHLADEAQLSLRDLPERPQVGYLWRRQEADGDAIDEVIAMPIVSTETGDVIAAIVLGFKPVELGGPDAASGIKRGLWLGGRLQLPSLDAAALAELAAEVTDSIRAPERKQDSIRVRIAGAPHLLFYKLLNPGSLYPPAYEVCLYPLTGLAAAQRHLLWQFVGAGGLLLLGALGASHVLASRLSMPVEKLAVDSEANRALRIRAEVALELTGQELQRSARFSADASHQLKTPVTVLRAGLEELLTGENLAPETREEIAGLVHQTFRLTSIIEDLLLLSRLDAGRLQLSLSPVNLTLLVEAWLDDLGTLADGLDLAIETDLAPNLMIAGEKRYTTLIIQNLLENARKYNRPGGRIRVSAGTEDGAIVLTIGNTGRPIPPAAQEHIFERFHRGTVGENVPGHGLGLNLARELARIHGGDLRLIRSDDAWTEFAVRFRPATP